MILSTLFPYCCNLSYHKPSLLTKQITNEAMDKISLLIADDEVEHLETIFEIVNSYDPLLPDDIFSEDSYVVEGGVSNRDYPCQLSGHADIQCVSSLNSAEKLFKNNIYFDVCITDINFSGEDADGHSIAGPCGASQNNKLLYTAREEVQTIYNEGENLVTTMEVFTRLSSEENIAVKYSSEERDDIIYKFLMEAEYRIADKKISSTPRSHDAKSAWKGFRRSLDALLSENEPKPSPRVECEKRLSRHLRDTNMSGSTFRHLFPFRYAFLMRRLTEAKRILDGDADETYPSWSTIKFEMDSKASQIGSLILDDKRLADVAKGDEVEQRRVKDGPETLPDSGGSTSKSENKKPRELRVKLRPQPHDSKVQVTTYEGETYSSTNMKNSGLFLLVAVMISESSDIPFDEPVSTTYYNKNSMPLFLSSLLIDKFNNPSIKSKYTRYQKTFYRPRDTSVDTKSREEIDVKYLKKAIKEGELGEKEGSHSQKTEYEILSLPENAYIHRSSVKQELEEEFEILYHNSQNYYISDDVQEIKINPEWIEDNKGEGIDEKWAEEVAEKLTN